MYELGEIGLPPLFLPPLVGQGGGCEGNQEDNIDVTQKWHVFLV